MPISASDAAQMPYAPESRPSGRRACQPEKNASLAHRKLVIAVNASGVIGFPLSQFTPFSRIGKLLSIEIALFYPDLRGARHRPVDITGIAGKTRLTGCRHTARHRSVKTAIGIFVNIILVYTKLHRDFPHCLNGAGPVHRGNREKHRIPVNPARAAARSGSVAYRGGGLFFPGEPEKPYTRRRAYSGAILQDEEYCYGVHTSFFNRQLDGAYDLPGVVRP